jgi:hypothetical protein
VVLPPPPPLPPPLPVLQVGTNATAAASLAALQEAAGAFYAPLVSGLELEAQAGLLPPCNDGPVNDTCVERAPWSATAQAFVSGAEGAYLPAYTFHANVTDAMHRVADIHPIHLPNITNKCVQACEQAGFAVGPLLRRYCVRRLRVTYHVSRPSLVAAAPRRRTRVRCSCTP